uniref:Auxin efflux carrier component n=1 Tax=Anthurium amnicola TaxID=1678845 RepID=A0A1D1ZAL9_9ARAE
MIEWGDIYKVVEAMLPLYTALGLGYGSVRWWRIFSPEQCEAINKLVSTFTLPLFTFEFTLHIDPFAMNYPFVAADAISKVVIVAMLAAWAKCTSKGSYCWSITNFSLSTLTNTLVVGVPMLRAMYGPLAQDLVVQSSIVQAIVWLSLLLFVLEWRKTGSDSGRETAAAVACSDAHVVCVDAAAAVSLEKVADGSHAAEPSAKADMARPPFWVIMRVVWLKLALNPNSYASIVGITWAFLANRWHFGMPGIMEGSILIMSKAGTGMAMFSMGLFMANQEKLISCGPSLMAYGMVLRFIAGPAAMTLGCMAVGLHGDVLRVAIIQAALPQSITSFIFAREYGLHADVLSTAVIFGMLISLPVLIAYYAVLEFLH